MLVLAAALTVFFVTKDIVTPLWRRLWEPWVSSMSDGPRTFWGHLVIWSFPMAVVSLLSVLWLVHTGRFAALSLRRSSPQAVRDGLWGALGVVTLSFPVLLALGQPMAFGINFWSIAGNLFSNAYEEIVNRALVFGAAWYCIGSALGAALISGVVFGFTHEQYPPSIQLYVSAVGALFCYVYARSGNLLAPWIAHQISDSIIDMFF